MAFFGRGEPTSGAGNWNMTAEQTRAPGGYLLACGILTADGRYGELFDVTATLCRWFRFCGKRLSYVDFNFCRDST